MKFKKIILGSIIMIMMLITTPVQVDAKPKFIGRDVYLSVAMSDGECAYVRHYYHSYFFFIHTGDGFYDELVGCI